MATLARVTEKRREGRFPARIVARIGKGANALELLTNDVSFRGVFIRTDAPPALRQLVQVELVLPDGAVIKAHAMVVHVARKPEDEPKGEGRVPGIGLQFWGPIDRARDWERFIHDLRVKAKAGMAAAKATDKVRRSSVRLRLQLEVVFDGKTSMTRDISENGMAIRTKEELPLGTHTQLELRSEHGSLRFAAIVRRTIDEPGFRGLGVELVGLDPERRAELTGFLRAATPSEEQVFVPVGDPKLH